MFNTLEIESEGEIKWGGGYFYLKRTVVLDRNFAKKPLGGTKILFCGRGLNVFRLQGVPILTVTCYLASLCLVAHKPILTDEFII